MQQQPPHKQCYIDSLDLYSIIALCHLVLQKINFLVKLLGVV